MTAQTASKKTVVMMAGGTGGHVFPALATAQELRNRGYNIHWFGTANSFEARTVPQYEIPLHTISIKGVRGKGVLGLALAPFRIMHAVGQCLALLMKLKPALVIGMGGFVSGPGGFAAKLLGIPVFIQEQNAVAGTTNRMLAKFATQIFTAFEHVLPSPNTQITGNPLRENILALEHYSERAAQPGAIRLLVVGGSLGALALNENIPKIMSNLDEGIRPDIIHQCGDKHVEFTEKAYAQQGVTAKVQPFIKDMETVYNWADVIICRAGALTVSEIISIGLPAIFIPLPHAIDDHQTANAKKLVEVGGALMYKQSEIDPKAIAEVWKTELNDRDKLKQMSLKLKSLSTGNATETIAQACDALLSSSAT